MKTQKGITLIALIITIIVMLILVGVSVSVALNSGLFKAAQGAAKNTEAERVNETQLSTGMITVINSTTQKPEQVDINSFRGSGESGESAKWEITTDVGEEGVSVGDLLTPTVEGLENEKFYVIADDGTTLTLLAERNVNTSVNVNTQASGINPVAFDDSPDVFNYNRSAIKGLVNAYVGTLTGLDLEDVEVADGGEPLNGVKGRLMWVTEVYDTAFTAATNWDDVVYGPSDARLAYWLGNPDEDEPGCVWSVNGDALSINPITSALTSDSRGVRPVIKILKSNV